MNTDRPIWLLDFDGVINATRPGWGRAPFTRGVYAPALHTRFVVRWSPALVDRIRAIIHAGDVDVLWATSWIPDTDRLERALGLPHLRSAWDDHADQGVDPAAFDHKWDAAEAVIRTGRPLIWTDDTVAPDVVAKPGYISSLLAAGQHALIIRPDTRRGLQPAHLDQIERFIGRHTHREEVAA
jgi:hypothetical protein